MNITQNVIDELNALITVTIEKEDYKEKVEKALNSYRKNATIKGFRKGQVPMSFVKKQYEKAAIYEEVNQMLQSGLNEHIQKEKLSILGNPLPKQAEDFNWDADPLVFEFEVGLAPDFKVDLSKANVENYKVVVGDDEVQKYVDNFAKRFGSVKSLDEVEEGEVNIKIQLKELDADKNEVEGGLDKETFLFMEEIANPAPFVGKKFEETFEISAKDISEDSAKLEDILGWTAEQIENFDGFFEVTIKEISSMETSAVDQSLFDKVYGEGNVKSEEEFRQKIKDEASKMYVRETDKQMMNDVVESLLKETKFDLPTDFLSRWLHSTNEKITSIEDAKEQLKKEEDGLRYQLIESKIAEAYDLKVEFDDVQNAAKAMIREQLAMYGQSDMPEEDLEKIVQGSLQNQEEFRKIADQVFADKLMQTFKDNAKLTEKEVTFEEFASMMEEKNKAHQAKHAHTHDHGHQH